MFVSNDRSFTNRVKNLNERKRDRLKRVSCQRLQNTRRTDGLVAVSAAKQ